MSTVSNQTIYGLTSLGFSVFCEAGDPLAPVDLTGASVLAEIRTADGRLIATFDVLIPTQAGDDLGRFGLSLDDEKVATVKATALPEVLYDVKVTDAAGVTFYPVDESTITLTRAVTEWA